MKNSLVSPVDIRFSTHRIYDTIASIAQQVACQSHNLNVVSSTFTWGNDFDKKQ